MREFDGNLANHLWVGDYHNIGGSYLTAACFARADASGGCLVSRDAGGGGSRCWNLGIGTNNANVISWRVESSVAEVANGATNVIGAGIVHACGVKDGNGANTLRVYLNGVLDGQTFGTGAIVTGGANIAIGRRHHTSQPFDGAIGEVAIWAAALTVPEIVALAKGFSPLMIRPDSLLSYWPVLGNDSPEPDYISSLGAGAVGTVPKSEHPEVYRPRSAIYVPAG